MVAARLSWATTVAERLAAAAGVPCPALRIGGVTGITRSSEGAVLVLCGESLCDRSDAALVGMVGHELGHLLAGHLDRPLTTRWRRFEYWARRVRFEIEANVFAVDLVGSDALVQSYVEEINAQLAALGHARSLTGPEVLAGESRFIAAELDQLAKVVGAVPSNRPGVVADIVAGWERTNEMVSPTTSPICR